MPVDHAVRALIPQLHHDAARPARVDTGQERDVQRVQVGVTPELHPRGAGVVIGDAATGDRHGDDVPVRGGHGHNGHVRDGAGSE
jgi:hypothetical protein